MQSNPMTVKRVFERHNRKIRQLSLQPPYLCDSIKDCHGQVPEIDGHKAPILVRVRSLNCIDLCPNDLLPLKGSKIGARLINDLCKIAQQVGADIPSPQIMLPPSLWSESGSKMKHLGQQASQICSSRYVRIVDQGVGVLWGFCRHWMWEVLHLFLGQEEYMECNHSQIAITTRIRGIIEKNGWDSALDFMQFLHVHKWTSLGTGDDTRSAELKVLVSKTTLVAHEGHLLECPRR